MNKVKKLSIVLLLSFLGSQCFAAEDSRMGRPFDAQSFKNVGLEVYLPVSPTWNHQFQKGGETDAIILTTPPTYYPSTGMQIKLHPELRVIPTDLPVAAMSALNKIRSSLKLPKITRIEDLQYVEYGQVKGYADIFDKKQGKNVFAFKNVFGIMPSEQPVSLMVSTPQGQLDHIEHMVIKVWKNLNVLPSSLPKSAPENL